MTTRLIVFLLLWMAIHLAAITVLAIHDNDGWALLVFVMLALSVKIKDKGEPTR